MHSFLTPKGYMDKITELKPPQHSIHSQPRFFSGVVGHTKHIQLQERVAGTLLLKAKARNDPGLNLTAVHP